jgi:hypothetical protein
MGFGRVQRPFPVFVGIAEEVSKSAMWLVEEETPTG